MDSDYCLICSKHTLGGIYCSQTCRLIELERSNQASALLQLEVVNGSPSENESSSATTTPGASPQFMPQRSSNLPSLPIINTLDRYIQGRRASTASVHPSAPQTKAKENTSIWRRRSILFYTA